MMWLMLTYWTCSSDTCTEQNYSLDYWHWITVADITRVSDVKSSRPKWPRGQNFGLGLEALASASISLSYYVIWHVSCKNRVKFGNFVNFPATILNYMLLIIIWYFFVMIFGLGLDLIVLASASASASRFWPRLTSLAYVQSSISVMSVSDVSLPRTPLRSL